MLPLAMKAETVAKYLQTMVYMVDCIGEWFDQVNKVFKGDISRCANAQKEIQLGHPQLPIQYALYTVSINFLLIPDEES